MMNSELAKKLQWLVQRQRNRIWLNRVLRHSAPLFIYSAAVFFLAGGIHQLLLPLSFPLIAGIAIVPSLAFLCLLAITHKPAAREGAALADELFAANSLFVSAWELTRVQSDNKGTAKLLLERCEKALPNWSLPTTQAGRGKLKPVGLITITLAMLGLFFLLQTSHVQPRQTSQATANSSLEQANAESAAAQKILSGLQDENSKPAAQTLRQPGASTKPTEPSSSAYKQALKQPAQPAATDPAASLPAAVNPLPASKPAMALAGVSPASNPGGSEKTGAHDAGNETAEAPDSNLAVTREYDRIQLVDIETGTDHRSIAGDESGHGGKLLEPEQAVSRQSAGNPWQQVSANGITYMLSPQQRNLVWRYFVQLDKIDDP